MRLIYPRLVGGLVLLLTPVLQRGALTWPSDTLWMVFTGLWLTTGCLLVSGRAARLAEVALMLLTTALILGPGQHLHSALSLLLWISVVLVITHDRPTERALLIRVLVTSVYVFAVLTKLNPSFLAGEQIRGIISDRDHLEPFVEIVSSPVSVVVAWLTLGAEAWLAVGLWFRRTVVPTVVLGAALHLALIAVANNGTIWDVAFVGVLNLGLVASYLAFFEPVRPAEMATLRTPSRC